MAKKRKYTMKPETVEQLRKRIRRYWQMFPETQKTEYFSLLAQEKNKKMTKKARALHSQKMHAARWGKKSFTSSPIPPRREPSARRPRPE